MATKTQEQDQTISAEDAAKLRELAGLSAEERAAQHDAGADETDVAAGDDAHEHDLPGDDDGEDGALFQVPSNLRALSGGKAPTSAVLKLPAAKIELAETLVKGTEVEVRLLVRVSGVSEDDEFDWPTGQVVGCVQVHKTRKLEAEVVE